jgi:hypothetical protein
LGAAEELEHYRPSQRRVIGQASGRCGASGSLARATTRCCGGI